MVETTTKETGSTVVTNNACLKSVYQILTFLWAAVQGMYDAISPIIVMLSHVPAVRDYGIDMNNKYIHDQ